MSTKTKFYGGVAAFALLTMSAQIAIGQDAPVIIDQTVTNTVNVSTGTLVESSNVTYDGSMAVASSTSVGASGATAAVSVMAVDAGFSGPAGGFGTIDQAVDNSGESVSNYGEITNLNAGAAVDGMGPAASMSISATGAGASVGVTGIASAAGTTFSFLKIGDVTQSVDNAAVIVNDGNIDGGTMTLETASSVSVGATGTVASISLTAIGGTFLAAAVDPEAAVTGGVIGEISQSSVNTGATIGNTGVITIGDLEGTGSRVGVSATGAVASVSLSSVENTNIDSLAGHEVGVVGQTATNAADITNDGDITVTGTDSGLSGTGSSASISASGSIASFSVSSLVDANPVTSTTVGPITQTSTNSGTMSNVGSIALTADLGTAASASISTTGAGGFVSFSTIGM